MLSVSRTAVQNGNRQEVKEELNSLPEELRAENPFSCKNKIFYPLWNKNIITCL